MSILRDLKGRLEKVHEAPEPYVINTDMKSN